MVDMVEKDIPRFHTILKTFSYNFSLLLMDRGSTGNLVHQAATKARKHLQRILGDETLVAVASTSKTMKDPFSGGS